MDMLSNIRVDSLTRLKVRLSGRWVNLATRRHWQGWVVADPLPVAVVFIGVNNMLFWSKSETKWWKFRGPLRRRDALEIGLTIWSIDELAKFFGISEEAVASGVKRSTEGLTQFNYSIDGAGITLSCTLRSSAELPDIMESRVVFTGELFRYTTIEGEPSFDLYCIFVAREDINILRKGLWRLRTSIFDGIPEPWKSMLGCGRQGKILLSENQGAF